TTPSAASGRNVNATVLNRPDSASTRTESGRKPTARAMRYPELPADNGNTKRPALSVAVVALLEANDTCASRNGKPSAERITPTTDVGDCATSDPVAIVVNMTRRAPNLAANWYERGWSMG